MPIDTLCLVTSPRSTPFRTIDGEAHGLAQCVRAGLATGLVEKAAA
jgi:hypothetical protein